MDKNSFRCFFILIGLLLTSCISRVPDADWHKDEYGCLKLRTKELAEKLVSNNKLMNSTKEDFLQVFNTPNVIEHNEKGEVWVYYMDTICADGKLIPEGDKCYADFSFTNNKLTAINFPCE